VYAHARDRDLVSLSAMAKNITIEGIRAPGMPIHHASFFELNEADGDVVLDLGCVDVSQLAKARNNPIDADEVVAATITHRFGMNKASLLLLQSQVNNLVQKLTA
jgi:hypothetical protein